MKTTLASCVVGVFAILVSGQPTIADESRVTADLLTSGEVALDDPGGMTLSPDGRFLYVSDDGDGRVVLLDAETLQRVAELSPGSRDGDGANGVDVDADGLIYIVDTEANHVGVFEVNGMTARLIAELSDRLVRPVGVLAHPNGAIYVTGGASDNVVAFRDGLVVGELTGIPSPRELELAADRNIWVAKAGRGASVLVSPDLRILDERDAPPRTIGPIGYGAVLPDGTVLSAEFAGGDLRFVGPAGEVRILLKDFDPLADPAQSLAPIGVEFNGVTVFMPNADGDKILKYRMTLN
jgi:DNA-binding beta-propeller fold protein YncE